MNRTMMVWFDLKASSFSSLTKLLLSFINLNSTKKNKSLQSFNYKEGLIKTVDDNTELLFCFGFYQASPLPALPINIYNLQSQYVLRGNYLIKWFLQHR